jgi:hypothetical protein
LENMVTNMILRDEIYIILFGLYSELHRDEIEQLKKLQDNSELLEKNLNLKCLQVSPAFQMDPDYKTNFTKTGRSSSTNNKTKITPYELPIRKLQKIDEIESPMCKLEHIYKCCTVEIQKCLDKFWRGYDIPNNKLSVDVDNLQSMIVYLISRMKGFPQILSSLYMIEDFLPDAV